MIQLTVEQRRRLKAAAQRRGVSAAEIARQGIERILADEERDARWDRLWDIVNHPPAAEPLTEPLKPHDEEWARAIEAKLRRGRRGRR